MCDVNVMLMSGVNIISSIRYLIFTVSE